MTIVKSNPEPAFGNTYANAVGALPGATEAWVDALRQTSRAVLGTQGFPGKKSEAWKYTSLNEIARTSFIPASTADDVDVAALPVMVPLLENAHMLVFVNGMYREDLSDSLDHIGPGISVKPFADVLKVDASSLKGILGAVAEPAQSFTVAMNSGFMEQGAVLRFEERTKMDKPIQILSIGASGSQPGAFHPRFEIVLQKGARATVIESHVGLPGQPYLSNPVTEILLAEEATLNHYTIVCEDSDAFHLGRTAAAVGAGARYESFILSLGGKLVRREVRVSLEEKGATAIVDGAYGLAGHQHSDITSEILHLAPITQSNQTVKGVLGGESRGVFQGQIHVARTAQGTDGRQLHKALMLNRGPEVDCKPELEIYADDVQCAHGATTGEMNPEHIFYLLSRGIDEKTARAMLVEGFLDDVIINIVDEPVRALVMDLVKAWLARQSMLITGEL